MLVDARVTKCRDCCHSDTVEFDWSADARNNLLKVLCVCPLHFTRVVLSVYIQREAEAVKRVANVGATFAGETLVYRCCLRRRLSVR